MVIGHQDIQVQFVSLYVSIGVMDLDLLCTYMLLLQTDPRGYALERSQNKKVMYYGAEEQPTKQGTLTES